MFQRRVGSLRPEGFAQAAKVAARKEANLKGWLESGISTNDSDSTSNSNNSNRNIGCLPLPLLLNSIHDYSIVLIM